jgi:exopolysaccharide biosynthesis polyprenyl glycosylphosphotransferase
MNIFDTLHRSTVIQILKKGNLLNYIFGALDIFLLLVTFQVSYYIVNSAVDIPFFFFNGYYLTLFVYMVPTWILVLHVCKIAQIPRTSRYSRMFLEYIQFTVLNIIFLYIFHFILHLAIIPATFIFLCAVMGLLVLYAMRIIEYKVFKLYRANGFNYVNVILIADGSAELFIEELLTRKEWGYRILMVFSDSKLLKAKFGDEVKILPEKSINILGSLLEFEVVDEVLYIKRKVKQEENLKQVLKSCEEVGVVFRLKSDISPVFLTSGQLSQVGGTTLLTFVNVPNDAFGLVIKNLMDTFASFFMIVLLSPIMLFIALCITVTSPGPVIFKQARVGLRGRQFYLYKFRTMVVNAEALRKQLEKQNEMDGPVFKIKSDPRITPIGKILRKTGLDELPQLFNVLKGEMSLIGPRPPLQSETRMYKRWQLRRLSVKPGITCSWQIIPDRNNVKFEHWMKLDLAYIDNWSPRLDFMLLLKTIRTVIFGTGA